MNVILHSQFSTNVHRLVSFIILNVWHARLHTYSSHILRSSYSPLSNLVSILTHMTEFPISILHSLFLHIWPSSQYPLFILDSNTYYQVPNIHSLLVIYMVYSPILIVIKNDVILNVILHSPFSTNIHRLVSFIILNAWHAQLDTYFSHILLTS